jgi:hypothetical protein
MPVLSKLAVLPLAAAGNYYVPVVGGPTVTEVASVSSVPYAGEYQRSDTQFLAPAPTQAGSDWGSAAGMAALGAAIGLAGTTLAKVTARSDPAPLATLAVAGHEAPFQRRARTPQMSGAWPSADAYGGIWGIEWKTACFNAWDPEKPRTYTNFNPFERNDESAMADTNGCFPGQSRGYTSPNRPDQSWEIMQAERAAMDVLKANPKYSITGKPGNFTRKWQDNLGPP